MDTISPDDLRYQRARKRVEELKGLYSHLAIFVIVNLGLFLINVLTTDTWWFLFPLIGWGIGLAAHAVTVFGEGSRFSRDWEERKIRQFMEQDR